jgi:hypothetical protein
VRDEKATFWAEMWLAIMPMLLGFPIGLGFGKPDFWSLDIGLSPFAATRPVSSGQLIAAKLKVAAWSALVSWGIVLIVAPIVIYLFCDSSHWRHLWTQSGFIYSPLSHWVLPFLAIVCALIITWSLLVRNIWLGYSGRPAFYYTLSSVGLAAFVFVFFYFVWWLDHPRSRADRIVDMMAWVPWALATVATIKAWAATWLASKSQREGKISARGLAKYLIAWIAATAILISYAYLFAPRIEYFRNTTILLALCTIPAVSIALAPFTIAWNRHR